MQVFITLVILALILLAFVFLKLRKRGLSKGDRKKVLKMWRRLDEIEDRARRVLEADSIFDKALGMLGYTGSIADKLKAAGPRIENLNSVWSAHKLRNQIAHEPGMQVSNSASDRALSVFKKAIDSL